MTDLDYSLEDQAALAWVGWLAAVTDRDDGSVDMDPSVSRWFRE
jgi:hypothetical protein